MFQQPIPEKVLSSKYIKLVIKAINDSRVQYEEEANERNFPTRNGRFLDRWNFIFNNIKNSFTDEPFKCFVIPRGALWEFVVIYNMNTNILYVLLKKDRFIGIKNDPSSKYHYVRVLNSQNYCFKNEREEQMSFLDDFKTSPDEYVYEDFEKMINNIHDEVKGCVNILFEEDNNGVTSISGNIATYDLDIIKSYNWNRYISANIEEITDTNDNESDIKPQIQLKIRGSKLKDDNKETIVDEKQKDGNNKSTNINN